MKPKPENAIKLLNEQEKECKCSESNINLDEEGNNQQQGLKSIKNPWESYATTDSRKKKPFYER